MVKFSPTALSFSYDFVLLLHFLGHLYIKKIMRMVEFTAKDVVCLCSADSSALWSIGAHPPPLSSPVLLPKTHYTLLVLLRPLLAAGLLPLAPLFPIIPLLLHSPPYGEICCTSSRPFSWLSLSLLISLPWLSDVKVSVFTPDILNLRRLFIFCAGRCSAL